MLWDVHIVICSCEGVPKMDLAPGLWADPFICMTASGPGVNQRLEYKTTTHYNTAAAAYNEDFRLCNVPYGVRVNFQVYDKDTFTPNELVGDCDLVLDEACCRHAAANGGSNGSLPPPPAPAPATATALQHNGHPHLYPPGYGPAPAPAPAPPPAPAGYHPMPQPQPSLPAPHPQHLPPPSWGPATLPAHGAPPVPYQQPYQQPYTPYPGPQQPGAWAGGGGVGDAGALLPSTADPQQQQQQQADQACGGAVLRLAVLDPRTRQQREGCTLTLRVHWTPSMRPPGPVKLCTPVRYRVSVSVLAGAITGHAKDGWLQYAAYKVWLSGLTDFFPRGASQPWNQSYDKARAIFSNPVMVAAIKSQHAMLYADSGREARRGVLHSAGDLFELLSNGIRAGQPRYYTYVLAGDGSLRFSETGAGFFTDFFSKHAMHGGCAEKVVCAGEFCLVPSTLTVGGSATLASASAPLTTHLQQQQQQQQQQLALLPPRFHSHLQPHHMNGSHQVSLSHYFQQQQEQQQQQQQQQYYPDIGPVGQAAPEPLNQPAYPVPPQLGQQAHRMRLVIDNNSGTYAPPSDLLVPLKQLLQWNLPGLQVETLDCKDPALKQYHSLVPSR